MSDRKGKIKGLSGLTKGGISFRFSPENEEIEEIMLQDPTAESKAQSLPDSSSGGDTSPIKEMFKHKWANTWEKRSLSLDLDLNSLFLRKKLSKTNLIPASTTSSSIAEHRDIGYSSEHHQHSISGQTSKNMSGGLSEFNLEGFGDDMDDVDEVGLDYVEAEDNYLDNLLKFNVAPELLQEYYDDETPLYYQHPRNYEELPTVENILEIMKEDLQPSTIVNNIFSSLFNHEWTKYVMCLIAVAIFLPYRFGASFICPILWILVGSFSIIIFQESVQSIPASTPANKNNSSDDKSKVIKTTTTATNSNPSGTPISSQTPTKSASSLVPSNVIELDRSIRSHITRSQGWMTEFEGEYDPFSCHVRQCRVVFVRLEGSMLYISYPHHKHRMQIPKRRLWNDPPITSEFQFVRHNIYSIGGAVVSIAPERLARKRAWNKKYPIAIKFRSNSTLAIISPSPSAESAMGSQDPLDKNTDTASTSSLSMSDKDKKPTEKKEIIREDCSHRVIYLFSRSDREKDDWFRRLISAAKIGSMNNSDSPEQLSSTLGDHDQDFLLQDYFEYMRKIIPFLGAEHRTEKCDIDKSTSNTNSSKSDGKEKSNSGIEKETTSKKDGATDKSESSSSSSKIDTPTSSRKGSPILDDSMGLEKILTIPQSPDFLNAFLGRIFHDFLRSPYWKAQVNDLIQKKLNYMRRPQFLDTLLVRELDLGSTIPIIQRASDPVVDKQGLWIDLDLSYDGNIVLTLETKLNLLKLRKSPSQETPDEGLGSGNGNPSSWSSSSVPIIPTANFSNTSDTVSVSMKSQSQNSSTSGPSGNANSGTNIIHSGEVPSTTSSSMTINHSNSSTPTAHQANIFDSDADDSGESSEDDMNPDDFLAQSNDSSSKDDQQNSNESTGASSKGMKILKMAEKIASSKYVQQATDLKVVKKAIANVANTPLVLSVEIKSLVGTLALNIPSPPTDRLWLGFRNNPSMQISARPKFGARAVNLTQVTDWITKKLLHEFQRVIVFPNMNDLTIPLMEFKLPK